MSIEYLMICLPRQSQRPQGQSNFLFGSTVLSRCSAWKLANHLRIFDENQNPVDMHTSFMCINILHKMNCEPTLTYDTPALRQTGSRNLTGQKTLPTIWGTYMKLVTKYQISAITSCWEKCAYMFNVYKNQLRRQTGSRNLTGPKTLPTIWYTYMMLVTKYQISAIKSYREKYLGWKDGQR